MRTAFDLIVPPDEFRGIRQWLDDNLGSPTCHGSSLHVIEVFGPGYKMMSFLTGGDEWPVLVDIDDLTSAALFRTFFSQYEASTTAGL